MNIVGISGSPSPRSRSGWLLQWAQTQFDGVARRSDTISVAALPAQELLHADRDCPPIAEAIRRVADADLLIVATPIYKAAYSGVLKLFLDLLPTDALRGKSVLPLASGGSLGHLLALDYALKPVLSALGARDILDGVFAIDAHFLPQASGGYALDPALATRLANAVAPLLERLPAVA